MDYNINFPNLHINFDHVGKNITIGGFSIAYYGIVIALGFFAGIAIACWKAKKTDQNPDNYFDLALIAIITSLIGARLYYVIFRWDYYKEDLLRIFKIREGGLAIYGGIIAAVITVFVFTRVKKLHFGQFCDTAVLGLILGQIIGRWGNFFNREAFGGYTNNLFAMQLPISAVRASEVTQEQWDHLVVIDGVSYIQAHPTFLYESLWNLAVLILLLVFFKKKKFHGEVFFWYLGGYGLGRFWIESLRTDQLLLPVIGYPVSQALAALLVLVSIGWIIVARCKIRKKEPQMEKLYENTEGIEKRD
ncbi:MAG: prolipoprotein diacylglyceryl transferase [Agathobacter sp.]|nr:prolipoprotein diacylglyceryl transferase [Agathobacter sp.]MBQ2283004.1 prolipoprotein diacylglyceryl transferase [Agathobacter sp.]